MLVKLFHHDDIALNPGVHDVLEPKMDESWGLGNEARLGHLEDGQVVVLAEFDAAIALLWGLARALREEHLLKDGMTRFENV